MNQALSLLPTEPIDRLTGPLARFLRIETVSGAVLLLAVLVALAFANSPWGGRIEAFWQMPVGVHAGDLAFGRPLRQWIDDGLMTLFFFLVALELKRELVLGELSEPRIAALSIAAAVGGMVVPAAIYFGLQAGEPGQHGWGTVMATDTAFVIGCLALLGRRVPQGLRVFLLSLAVVDDIGAILVVAVGYGEDIDGVALALAAGGLAAVRGMAIVGVRNLRLYVLAGMLIWLAVDASGLHPTVTGVVLGLMTPTGSWVSAPRLHAILRRVQPFAPGGDRRSGGDGDRRALRAAGTAARESLSPVERLLTTLHPWVAFGVMPIFALANAGVPIFPPELGHPVAIAVVAGFILGKPLGVVGFAWLAVCLRLAVRPRGLDWSTLAGGGLLAGIGFTMALFIANLAFHDHLREVAKVGIMAGSLASAVSGIAVLSWLDRNRGAAAGAERDRRQW